MRMETHRRRLGLVIASQIDREDEGQCVHEAAGVRLDLSGHERYIQQRSRQSAGCEYSGNDALGCRSASYDAYVCMRHELECIVPELVNPLHDSLRLWVTMSGVARHSMKTTYASTQQDHVRSVSAGQPVLLQLFLCPFTTVTRCSASSESNHVYA